jgi:hypothetical protein
LFAVISCWFIGLLVVLVGVLVYWFIGWLLVVGLARPQLEILHTPIPSTLVH